MPASSTPAVPRQASLHWNGMSETTINPELNDQAARIRDVINGQRDHIKQQLTELVSYNSVHNEPSCEQDCAAAGAWVKSAMTEVGLDVREEKTADGSLAYIGTKHVSDTAPTVLLYCHYDVVPAGNPGLWVSGAFELTERDGRWYGRGTADCKGNVVMHFAALRTAEELGGAKCNITMLVEGSEERGGEGLDDLIKRHPELFEADTIIIADTGNVAVGVPTITTSLRGGAQVVVTVDTLRTQVHSGGFGGPAPDATFALMRIINSLRDESGAVTIDGVDCTRQWEGVGYDAETFRSDAGILDGVDILGDSTQIASQLWARPAISVTGFSSTPVAHAVNAVPNTAQAKLNLRIPAGLDSHDVVAKLEAHLRAHAPWGVKVDIEVSDVNQPFQGNTGRTLVSDCLGAAYGKDVEFCGTGGSIPLCTALQEAYPDAEIVLYGVEEPLCTIHSPNESVDPTEIEAIATAEALYLLNRS